MHSNCKGTERWVLGNGLMSRVSGDSIIEWSVDGSLRKSGVLQRTIEGDSDT